LNFLAVVLNWWSRGRAKNVKQRSQNHYCCESPRLTGTVSGLIDQVQLIHTYTVPPDLTVLFPSKLPVVDWTGVKKWSNFIIRVHYALRTVCTVQTLVVLQV
jgi:hypothetical protein